MPQQIGWSVEAKLLYEIKQLTRQLSGRQYILTFPTFASFPTPGITGTLYVDESTGDIYVWNGTAYTILSSGITALNGLIAAAQLLTTGSTGTDFNISSVGTTHTFNIPTASATNRGLLSSANWTTFNNKQNAITLTTTGTSGAATLVGSTLNIPQYQSVLTNPVTGTGTTNYVPKFTASGTIGNSQIFDNGTRVGIGTASPAAKIDVRGTGTQDIYLISTTATNVENSLQSYFNNGGAWADLSTKSQNLIFNTGPSGGPQAERLRITSGGNVGIGTTAPNGKLDVANAGDVAIWATATSAGSAALYLYPSGGGVAQIASVGAVPLQLLTNGSERMRIFANGRVGINTTTDAGYQLDINGTLRSVNGANFATTSGSVGIGTTTTTNGKVVIEGAAGYLLSVQESSVDKARVRIYQDATDTWFISETGNATQTNMRFNTGGQTRMFLDKGGNVGIGTASPAYKFHTLTSDATIAAFRNSGAANGQILIGNTAGDLSIRTLSTGDSYIFSDAGKYLDFGSNASFRMRLTSDGELLVSTTTDAGDYKLQVVGNQYLSGKLVVGTTTDSGQTVQINSSLRLIPTSTVPTASAGTLYYDTATNKLKLYNGTSWVDLN